MLFITLLTYATFIRFGLASYVLEDDYGTTDFFDNFDFYTGTDPTNGFVDYVDQSTAESTGLISTGSTVYMGADHTNVASSSGRESVRISSTKTYNHGLFILDLSHMPGNACGSWPAFWLLGLPTWPDDGEIDIIEGINSQIGNDMTLHTSSGCSITNSGDFTGTEYSSDCYGGDNDNTGCQIQGSTNTATYGDDFNSAGGGVYATEWTSDVIQIWFFESGSIPSDITSGSPVPSGWGTPLAKFSLSCDIDSHFIDMEIVFDITFCGDWAGQSSIWSSDSTCSALDSSCDDYVMNNPSAFESTYWTINSLKVYSDSTSYKREVMGNNGTVAHGNMRRHLRPQYHRRQGGFF
ncbi:MAG: hypothetical protein M1834_002218 [Cirrosporium novae-zelandiae]|nr:MAG: hypothetical protein M1834_002218 [Cirrosporium novae-zelandiae]